MAPDRPTVKSSFPLPPSTRGRTARWTSEDSKSARTPPGNGEVTAANSRQRPGLRSGKLPAAGREGGADVVAGLARREASTTPAPRKWAGREGLDRESRSTSALPPLPGLHELFRGARHADGVGACG